MKKFTSSSLFALLFTLTLAGCKTPAPPAPQLPMPLLPKETVSIVQPKIPPPPAAGSREQKADEKELLKWQKARTKADCERAATEVIITLGSFYGPPYGPLTAEESEKLAPDFQRIRSEAGAVIGAVKNNFSRTRPYEYIKGAQPCIEREKSKAYPSGHATLAQLDALILMDLFPDRARQLQARMQQLALDRVLGGVHHTTDIVAGQQMGELIYREMTKTDSYRTLFQEMKAKLTPQ